MGLDYAVITVVNRDDLPDAGASASPMTPSKPDTGSLAPGAATWRSSVPVTGLSTALRILSVSTSTSGWRNWSARLTTAWAWP